MVITTLVSGGTSVTAGDLLVEFDPQEQHRLARDRRSDFLEIEEQIRRMSAEQAAARAKDTTELLHAEHDVDRARLLVSTNDLLSRIEAEKNSLTLEQAGARLAQIRQSTQLKRDAAAADLRILQIRRGRAASDASHAERNAGVMSVRAPFAGLAVVRTTVRGGPGQMTEIQQGEEVRPGIPIVDVIDPAAMRVRALINQADIAMAMVGQRATIQLDAYPGLLFEGRVEQLSPLGVPSGMTPAVRSFVAIVSVAGHHERLMPDLSAAVDLEVEHLEDVLVVPRDVVSVGPDGPTVRRASNGATVPIVVAAASALHVAIASGVEEGDVLLHRGVDP